MQPLVCTSQTGNWIPACAGMTDSAQSVKCSPATTLPAVFVGECVTSVKQKKIQHLPPSKVMQKRDVSYCWPGCDPNHNIMAKALAILSNDLAAFCF